MKLTLGALALALMAAGPLAAQTPARVPPPKTHLKVGDAAPDFTLRTTQGQPFHLAEQKGKTVVVAFFPAAFTGG